MAKSERRKKLEETMKLINKTQKDTVIDFGKNTEDLEVIPTGVPEIDDFLGGGTKRGTYTIFWGGFSVGKTSLVLQQIAHAQKEDKICCYINLEKPIDQSRFHQFGVNLDDLVLANHCKNAEQALEIIRTLCREKVADIIVIDSLNAMAPKGELESKTGKERPLEEKNIAELARVMSEFCRKANPAIYNAKASIIIIGQTRIGGIGTFFTKATMSGGEAIKFYAYNMVFMRRGQNADAPVQKFKKYYVDPEGKIRFNTVKEPVGFDVVMKMNKTNASKSAKENEEIHIPFFYETGFLKQTFSEEDIPIINGGKNDEEIKMINDHLKEKGLIEEKKDNTEIDEEITSKGKAAFEDFNEEEEVLVKPKKKRGRPKKKDK